MQNAIEFYINKGLLKTNWNILVYFYGGYMAKKTNFEVNGSKYFRVTRTVGHKADRSEEHTSELQSQR